MAEGIVQRDAGLLKKLLRTGMRLSSRFFPSTATVRQTKYHGLPIVVWANEHIGRRIILTGRFEEDEVSRFASLVRRGDVCIDVGANIGTHTVTLAKQVGLEGKVFAFEPIVRNALLVELNASINGFGNVSVDRRPLSDTSGKRLAPAQPDADSAYAYFAESASGAESVTLDDFCREKGISPSFIKIDVEGAELSVLAGAEGTLQARTVRCVVVEMVDEYLSRFAGSVAQVCDLMGQWGYSPFAVRGGELGEVTPSEILAENVYFLPSAQE